MEGQIASLPVSSSYSKQDLMERIAQDIPPESGEEYLARVRLEASKLPEVFNSQHSSQNVHKQVELNEATLSSSEPPWVLPPEAWRDRFMKEFKELRNYMAIWMAELPKLVEEGFLKIPLIPKRHNTIAWHHLLYGEDRNVPKHIEKQHKRKDELKDAGKDIPFTKIGSPPLLGLVLHIDHGTVEKLIKDHVWSLNEVHSLETHRALWIFALLARLERPITGDMAADLTKLTRLCRQYRDNILESEVREKCEEICVLNMLILICEDYFQQIP